MKYLLISGAIALLLCACETGGRVGLTYDGSTIDSLGGVYGGFVERIPWLTDEPPPGGFSYELVLPPNPPREPDEPPPSRSKHLIIDEGTIDK